MQNRKAPESELLIPMEKFRSMHRLPASPGPPTEEGLHNSNKRKGEGVMAFLANAVTVNVSRSSFLLSVSKYGIVVECLAALQAMRHRRSSFPVGFEADRFNLEESTV